MDGSAHALEGVEQHERGRASHGVARRGGAQGFERGLHIARPGMDEAVAGDGGFERFLEAGEIIGQDDGAQLGGADGPGAGAG